MMANIDLRAAAAGALGERMNSSRVVVGVIVGWLSFFINKMFLTPMGRLLVSNGIGAVFANVHNENLPISFIS
jgi:hypothetical protein